jgi:hypothetical protein
MDLSNTAKIFIDGFVVLLVAVGANILASAIKLSSWYDFLGLIGQRGVGEALTNQSVPSLIWLFIAYPLILGLAVYWLR